MYNRGDNNSMIIMELPICKGKIKGIDQWFIGLVRLHRKSYINTGYLSEVLYFIQDITYIGEIYEVDETTICRYTYLNGIDNKEIYEDDIVEIQDNLHERIKWLVCWDTAYAHFFLLNMNPKPGEDTSLDFTQVSPLTIKILGNIHEESKG